MNTIHILCIWNQGEHFYCPAHEDNVHGNLDISFYEYILRIMSTLSRYLLIWISHEDNVHGNTISGYLLISISHEGNSLSRYLLIMRLALILEGAGMEMSQKLMWIMILLSKYVYCTKCKKLITKKNICTNLLCTLGDRNNKRIKYICSTMISVYLLLCQYNITQPLILLF